MASDNHANYTKIGMAIMLGSAAIVWTLIHIAGVGGRGKEVLLETYYDAAVTGLSVGSPVNLRGVKVGEVREIALVGTKYDQVESKDVGRIYILMALLPRKLGLSDDQLEVAEREVSRYINMRGFRASVVPTGITGMSRIEVDEKREGMRPMSPYTWKPHHVVIPSELSLMDNFSVAATKVMNQINSMDFSTAWSNIYVTVESLTVVTRNLRTALEMHRPEIDRVLGHIENASSAADDLTRKVRDNPAVLLRGTVEQPLPETSR